jgi:hypothetical protein
MFKLSLLQTVEFFRATVEKVKNTLASARFRTLPKKGEPAMKDTTERMVSVTKIALQVGNKS